MRLLYDLQSKQGRLQHWAKLQNLKLAAKTFAWLEEHGIDNYADLESKAAAVTGKRDTAHTSIKEIEAKTAELSLVMKHTATYRQLKPVYDRYWQSRDKVKFLRGHESESILFEAAARELKRKGDVPLPSTESMKTELAALAGKKDALLAEYRAARSQTHEYETIKKNVDTLLRRTAEKMQSKVYELT